MTEIVKKAVIDRSKIVEVNPLNEILVRYRVIFDKTKYSDYSMVYPVKNLQVRQDTDAKAVLSNGRIQINWSNINNFTNYDLYVKYSGETDYVYLSRTSGISYNFVPAAGKTASKVWVQLACTSKVAPTERIRVSEITVS
jgi:K+-transporting ATPase A subunit